MTPCINICKIEDNLCIGCHRTLDQIANWRHYSMDDRMKVMKEIQQRTSTHECPDCGSLTYCAMEDGKSSNLCWCMHVEADPEINPMVADSKCLCKKCLCG